MNQGLFKAIATELQTQFFDAEVVLQKEFEGFQQRLAEIQILRANQALRCFVKCFVSNASWWSGNAEPLFEREVAAIEALSAAGLSVPELMRVGLTGQTNWLLMKDIGGEPFLAEAPNFDPEQLGVFLARLHRTDLEPTLKSRLCSVDVEFIETRFGKMASVGGSAASAVDEMVRIASGFSQESELVFCHGDLHFGNLVLEPDGDYAVFDFEEAVIGYRQYDVAGLGLFVEYHFGKAHARRFQAAYAAASGYGFAANLLVEWADFIKLRDSIVGIYLNNQVQGLPFEKGLFVEDKEAEAEMGAVLKRRLQENQP